MCAEYTVSFALTSDGIWKTETVFSVICPAVVKVIKYSLQVSFGGIAFGFVMAKTTIFWLRNIFNDALAEITITLASTYLTFYIGITQLGNRF